MASSGRRRADRDRVAVVEQQLAAPAASHIYFGARVRAALQNAQFDFPTSRRITVNLAPADLPKESGRFDLPIAIGILVATEQVPGHRLHEYEFAGELIFSMMMLL